MSTFQDCLTYETINWLRDNNLKYKVIDIAQSRGKLIIIFNDKFCLKVYDRLGHGVGVDINVAEKYDEGLYKNDSFNLAWAYKYFNVSQTASFNRRTESQYILNLPNLINDLKNIIPPLDKMNLVEWNKMKEWISKEARKDFT